MKKKKWWYEECHHFHFLPIPQYMMNLLIGQMPIGLGAKFVFDDPKIKEWFLYNQ